MFTNVFAHRGNLGVMPAIFISLGDITGLHVVGKNAEFLSLDDKPPMPSQSEQFNPQEADEQ